jgi:hypothetical protein
MKWLVLCHHLQNVPVYFPPGERAFYQTVQDAAVPAREALMQQSTLLQLANDLDFPGSSTLRKQRCHRLCACDASGMMLACFPDERHLAMHSLSMRTKEDA